MSLRLKLQYQISNTKIIAVEQDPRSISYTEILDSRFKILNSPLAVVVGHETEGVSKEVLDMADIIVEIPMFGVNKSLNVIVSVAIVVYKIIEDRKVG